MTVFDLHPQQGHDPVQSVMNRAMTASLLYEALHVCKDGSVIPVEVSSTGAFVDGQRVLISVVRNISERRFAEQALQQYRDELYEAKERFRVTLQSIGDAVIATDVQARITFMNAVAEKLTGWDNHQALGLRLDQVFHIINEQSRQPVNNPVDRVLTTGQIVGLANHTVLVAADGREIPIADSAAPIRDAQGKIEGVVLVFRDVTAERQAQALLKASEERYRTTFENTGTAMVIIEADTTIRHVNKQMEILSGYSREELEGKRSFFDLVSDRDTARMREYHRQRRERQPAPRVYEFDFVDRYGTIKHCLVTVDLISGTGQSVASLLDITERKEAEERVKFLSLHDTLTGLPNRGYFDMQLGAIDREQTLPYSVIIGDVNGLKLVNDAFGHETGDELLRDIANILVSCSRKGDTVARWGGDEFIILCPQCDEAGAQKVINRIKAACQAASETRTVNLSISLGCATKQRVMESTRDVIRLAEDRMYQQKLMETRSYRSAILASLISSLRERNYETEEHAQRLRELCVTLGQVIGLSQSQLNELALLSALHDIGKLAIPDHILMKPGPLSEAEWEVMRRHAEIGYRIADSTPELRPLAEAILSHHEHWDGRGYPRGLAGEEIPLLSRILAIVDAYDAMTHERPYREAVSHAKALAELERCAGTQFDPDLVAVFVEQLEQRVVVAVE